MAVVVPEAIVVRVGMDLHNVFVHAVCKVRVINRGNVGVDLFGSVVKTDHNVARFNVVTIGKAMFEITDLQVTRRDFRRDGYEVVDIHSALATASRRDIASVNAGRIM